MTINTVVKMEEIINAIPEGNNAVTIKQTNIPKLQAINFGFIKRIFIDLFGSKERGKNKVYKL